MANRIESIGSPPNSLGCIVTEDKPTSEIITKPAAPLTHQRGTSLIPRGLRELMNLGGRPESIRVIIVNDDKATVNTLRVEIDRQDDMEVVGVAYDGDTGVKRAKLLDSDVIIMNGYMPGISGLEASRQILSGNRQARIILHSAWFSDKDLLKVERYVQRAQQLGIYAWLESLAPIDVIIKTVRRVASQASGHSRPSSVRGIVSPVTSIRVVAYTGDRRWPEVKQAIYKAGHDIWLVSIRVFERPQPIEDQLDEITTQRDDMLVVVSGLLWGRIDKAVTELSDGAIHKRTGPRLSRTNKIRRTQIDLRKTAVITWDPTLQSNWKQQPGFLVRWKEGYLEALVRIIDDIRTSQLSNQ